MAGLADFFSNLVAPRPAVSLDRGRPLSHASDTGSPQARRPEPRAVTVETLRSVHPAAGPLTQTLVDSFQSEINALRASLESARREVAQREADQRDAAARLRLAQAGEADVRQRLQESEHARHELQVRLDALVPPPAPAPAPAATMDPPAQDLQHLQQELHCAQQQLQQARAELEEQHTELLKIRGNHLMLYAPTGTQLPAVWQALVDVCAGEVGRLAVGHILLMPLPAAEGTTPIKVVFSSARDRRAVLQRQGNLQRDHPRWRVDIDLTRQQQRLRRQQQDVLVACRARGARTVWKGTDLLVRGQPCA